MTNKTLVSLFDTFIKQQQFVAKIAPETMRGYKSVFKLLIKLMGDHITTADLTEDFMTTFFEKIGKNKQYGRKPDGKIIKNSTVATYRSKLNKFFEWLVSREEIKENPFKSIPYPEVNYDDKKWLKKEEVEKVRACIELRSKNSFIRKRNLAMLGVLTFCGLRLNELINIRISDIDLERKFITVNGETSKSKRSRIIPLNIQTIECIKDYMRELRDKKDYQDQYLWASSTTNHRLTKDGLKHIVESLNTKSGVNFHLHQFRHTFAINAIGNNIDISKLKQLMGHKDIRMTAVYLRHIPVESMANDLNKLNYDNIY